MLLRELIKRQDELNVLHKTYRVRAETEQDRDSLESPFTNTESDDENSNSDLEV